VRGNTEANVESTQQRKMVGRGSTTIDCYQFVILPIVVRPVFSALVHGLGPILSTISPSGRIPPSREKSMAHDPHAALVAWNRFGLGARGGVSRDFAAASADPRGFVKAELDRPRGALVDGAGLRDTAELAQLLFDYQHDIKEKREALAMAKAAAGPDDAPPSAMSAESSARDAPPGTMAPADSARTEAHKALNVVQQTYRAEALARVRAACRAEVGLVERLTMFWSNHFCVSANKGQQDRIWAGAFEREAIRPHVLGRFGDMLRAVEQHPAMLFFLDNQQSIGPNSRAGQNRHRGLNENLAREIMELHTLGVGGGYTQADVTALARILPG